MDDWYGMMAAGRELSPGAVGELCDAGFVIIPGPVPPDGLARLAEAYDAAVAGADAADVSVGSSTTRVHDLVNRGPEFDALYVHRPVLEACCRVIGRPFRLSTLLARTVRPHSPAQALHADFGRDAEGWPMVGFILMVDEFRSDNGATRFVPGSHRRPATPCGLTGARPADDEPRVRACGPAGSVIIYNGSVRHGHSANLSGEPRRSIQGAYIRREAQAGVNLPARMRPETLARIGALAKYLLAV
ncbi:MAG TPA: phytanoyl-CoA dioxygenase family protein [Pyrinomonadaceae bacterium]|jgi:ectoine hydroxylase-related dioxygenase (phytanoyl-CoA dioxygenase family)